MSKKRSKKNNDDLILSMLTDAEKEAILNNAGINDEVYTLGTDELGDTPSNKAKLPKNAPLGLRILEKIFYPELLFTDKPFTRVDGSQRGFENIYKAGGAVKGVGGWKNKKVPGMRYGGTYKKNIKK
tara:strand:- start:148 stop:528 length:381 start_codon:yes stop_codon:yes gene_type:complete